MATPLKIYYINDITDIPAAACGFCGGWTGMGGMSHHANDKTPVLGRTGCSGPHCCVSDEAREIARTTIITNPYPHPKANTN